MYAIDVHAHVFPEKVAGKAVPKLSEAAGVPARGKGTLSDLEEMMERGNVKRTVLAPIATRPDQVVSINNWVKKQESEKFIPFGAIHPEDPGRFGEIERICEMGIRGVKMHPNYQEFYPDEDRFVEICRALADAGLILLLHGGVDLAFEEVNASPERMARLLEAVPDLKIIIAHFGGFQRWDKVERLLAGSRAWFDISFTLSYIEEDRFLSILSLHGTDKLLFGTDYPWTDAGEQIRILEQFQLEEPQMRAILHENAERLLDLPPLE